MITKIIILTILFELVTVLFRFGLGIRATRDTAWFARYTFNYRIHHGYWGAVLLVVGYAFLSDVWLEYAISIGWALVLSDLIHHFLVLLPITGKHEFDITYPKKNL